MKTLILSMILSLSTFASMPDFKSHFFINGKKVEGMKHIMVMPNTPTLLEMYFTDPRDGEVYKDYKIMHGKYMHMVIANKDLSVFKHTLFNKLNNKSTGTFSRKICFSMI